MHQHRAHRPLDEGTGQVATAIPGLVGLVCAETGTGASREGGVVARLARAGGAIAALLCQPPVFGQLRQDDLMAYLVSLVRTGPRGGRSSGLLPVVSKNTNELKTRLGCNKQVQMAKQPGGNKWPARWPPHGRCPQRPRAGRWRACVPCGRPLRRRAGLPGLPPASSS